MDNHLKTNLEIIMAAQPGTENLALNDIPFDDFYSFFVENKDDEKGDVIGAILIQRFRDGFDLKKYTPDADPDKVLLENSAMLDNKLNIGMKLVDILFKCNMSLMRKQDQRHQESLEELRETLAPFFTTHMKARP